MLKKAIESLEMFKPEDLSPAVVARPFTAISQLINTGSEAAARALALDELLERVEKTLQNR